jgi:hypothetical protein
MSDIIKIRKLLLEIGFSQKVDYSGHHGKYIFNYKKYVFEITDWAIDYEDKKLDFRGHVLLTDEEGVRKMYNFILLEFSKELRKYKIRKILKGDA